MKKKVKCDLTRNGEIACCHVETECETVEDLKEALAFAEEASNLIPQINNN